MNKNKYGVILYKDTVNLGDDIQTYAATKFLPRVDYVIDRESISSFTPKKEEKVKTIMNGWYNHDKTQFLISPYIDPLFISMHFSANDLILKPGYSFLDGYAKKIMSKYRIGCRDKNTLSTLKKIGYKDVYFSSCLTTTINPVGHKKEQDYVVAVDMNPKIVNHLREITDMKIIETTHWLIANDDMTYDKKLKVIDQFDKASTEERKKMVEKHSKLSFEERMKLVEKQLVLYQNAKLVITDRIHVGLPCLGLNTNVLLIYYEYNKDRIETFKEFLPNCTEEEFLQMSKKDLSKIKNKSAYKRYREQLIKDIEDFVKEETITNDVPKIEIFKNTNLKREEYIKGLYLEKIESLKEENKRLKDENQKLAKEKEFFDKIRYSKSWKLIGKYYENKVKKSK